MNIQDYTPERICEALCWLYGGEWKEAEEHSFGRPFVNINKDHEVLVMRNGNCVRFYNHQHHYSTVITGCISHALTVTEPWEWKREKTGHLTYNGVVIAGLYPKGTQGIPWWWWLGTTKHEDTAPDVESAKTAARAAYLTWMRGRLAMEGRPA